MTINVGRKQLFGLIGVVVLVGAGGWVAGTQLQSPADAAAGLRPPKAGPVTVAVERRQLTANVVAQGTVEFASPQPLSLAGAVGSGSAAGGSQGQPVEQRVTKAPTARKKLKQGDVLMEVSGRPVLVLTGSVPMYRTIGPGTSGNDVAQLQKNLRQLGFYRGDLNGVYGQGTSSAVTSWYKSKGYQAQEPSVEDRQKLGQLQEAVTNAQLNLLSAKNNTTTGSDPKNDTTSAEPSPAGEDKALDELKLKAAQQALDSANNALSAFQSSYGTTVPAGEIVFLRELPMRVDKVTVRAGDAPNGEIGTVTSSDLVVEAVVDGTNAQLLRRGMAVQLKTTDDKEAKGVVTEIGTGESGAGESGTTSDQSGGIAAPVQVKISVPEPGPLAGRSKESVTVTVETGASKGPVLTVPVAAIRTAADGQARVRVKRGESVVTVRVTVGLSAAGVVEVKPADGELEPGDRVVVGE
ncbi:peptidoglycan-binding protein [Streptomyces sp. NPDC098781]|uniref:peptidoglycan-binding protein n=1 Tax=Streptomyces sp. NPDC098781 TaxID=3366097 RepID=UPI00380744E3